MRLRKKDQVLRILNGSLVDLPSPSRLSYFWNFGSLLGLFLMVQILTGLFLSIQFSGSIFLSFDSVVHIVRDVNYGWRFRILHANGASFFFLFMYFHIGRGIYYGSYRYIKTWLRGVTIFLLSIGTAFLGYILPWGQMSFWAATVITNLVSAIPYLGIVIVEWLWGGFSVGNPTLIRFFAFHFILPFIILFLLLLHLMFLHESGSGNPLGLVSDYDKVGFYPYFLVRDLYGYFCWGRFFILVCFFSPYVFMDVENFISSNPMVTPVHIQPEWYFLFAYSILRAVPSKIGGVIALLFSLLILYFFPYVYSHKIRRNHFYPIIKVVFWRFVVNILILTWIGACEVISPYIELGIIFRCIYFFIYFVFWMGFIIQDFVVWLYLNCFESSCERNSFKVCLISLSKIRIL
jgi:ubiquinol-cytochrome c reductase cytochrome b subunit